MARPTKTSETPESVAKQLADAEAKVQRLKDKMNRIENEAYIFTGKQMKNEFGDSLPSDKKAQKAFISLLARLYLEYGGRNTSVSEQPQNGSQTPSGASVQQGQYHMPQQ